MYNTEGMYSNFETETNKEYYKETKSEGYSTSMEGCTTNPVYECPCERVIHREIVHHVPHVCPVNTRIINHHIYKHTYSPCYTCSEENEVCNVNEGCPYKF